MCRQRWSTTPADRSLRPGRGGLAKRTSRTSGSARRGRGLFAPPHLWEHCTPRPPPPTSGGRGVLTPEQRPAASCPACAPAPLRPAHRLHELQQPPGKVAAGAVHRSDHLGRGGGHATSAGGGTEPHTQTLVESVLCRAGGAALLPWGPHRHLAPARSREAVGAAGASWVWPRPSLSGW